MAEEETSGWVCCKCGSPNFYDEICFVCGHPKCETCKNLTEEEAKQITEGEQKAGAWLTGQERNKSTFSKEAYEKNLKETQLADLQEQIESQMEEVGERKDVPRKKR